MKALISYVFTIVNNFSSLRFFILSVNYSISSLHFHPPSSSPVLLQTHGFFILIVTACTYISKYNLFSTYDATCMYIYFQG